MVRNRDGEFEESRNTTNGKRTQCTATNRQGERCKRSPVPFANVCNLHGGKLPQVRKKAAQRLLTLIDPAISVLQQEMENAETSKDRQSAANSILDRGGVPRTRSVVDDESARDLLIDRIIALRDQSKTGTDPLEGLPAVDFDDDEEDTL